MVLEFKPVELALFTAEEAAQYLRLESNGKAAMDRLVAKGHVKACIIGNVRRYARRELDRYIDERTQVG